MRTSNAQHDSRRGCRAHAHAAVLAAAAVLATPLASQEPIESAESSPTVAPQDPVQEPPQEPPPATGGEQDPPEAPALPQVPAAEPAAEAAASAPAPPRAYRPSYHNLDDVRAFVDDWSLERPGLIARRLDLGRTRGGIEIPALELGLAGDVPLEMRPCVLLIGALDGTSFAGAEAVLHVASSLVATPASLPANVAFLVVPWGSPDALARNWGAPASGRARAGGNALPVDEDGDGREGEDPPDDLDGDGFVLGMLVEDPAGPLARGADARFLVPARPGDAPRYRRVPEGRDDDGDGRFNEDGPGGVVLDRSFPLGWPGSWTGAPCGPLPLSEPEARSLADLCVARKLAVAIVFQGAHGQLAFPGAASLAELGIEIPAPADRAAFARVLTLFGKSALRPGASWLSLWEARGALWPTGTPTGGAACDWFYASLGALAFELAPWGPEVERGPNGPVRASTAIDASGDAGPGTIGGERAWARWLDDRRGGIGFSAWHPVEVGGQTVLVGGWEPGTIDGPPEAILSRALEGLDRFVRDLAQGLPALSIELISSERRGDLIHLAARVRNGGLVPSGMGESETGVMRLELPEGAALLAGEARISFGHLAGGGVSATAEWLVRASEGAPLVLRAEDRAALPVAREVRP